MKETSVSRAYIAVIATTDSGDISATPANAANTLITACPAIMFPASRIEWLTGRTKYDMISIIASAGLKANGADEIQKRDKKPTPFFANPIMVTDKNTTIAITAVTAM